MWSFSGPNAHQGSTPTKDPLIPEVTRGGDFAQPGGSRPHREILAGAMVMVVAFVAIAAWALFKPAGDDTAARASAAEVGLTVSNAWEVEKIDGGFRVTKELVLDSAYSFDIVEAPSVSAPANASTWEPTIAGATAYAENDPPIRVFIDAGAHSWIVTCITPWIYLNDGTPNASGVYQSEGKADAAWEDLAASISFAPGT